MIRLCLHKVFLVIAICSISVFGQLGQLTYQGPAAGSVTAGVTVSTDQFDHFQGIHEPEVKGTRNVMGPKGDGGLLDFPPIADNYFEDKGVKGNNADSSMALLFKSFRGINDVGTFIPPDPHVAVGPNHIIAVVNCQFAIFDKEGNLLKLINADPWYQSILPNADAFDPQIMYDHYANRWFMLWDSYNDGNQTAHFLISVSDDSDPLGTWYNWALPAHLNGTTATNFWGDYPGIGFDEQAFYINSRQFSFGTTSYYYYNKIRIISKELLYSSIAGPLSWNDIWDISIVNYPMNPPKPDVIRPCITYGPSPAEALFIHCHRLQGNYLLLFKISNPLTNPVLTYTSVPVTFYSAAPNANQPGGTSANLIASNESHIKTAPVYRNGSLWTVHSVQNPNSGLCSAIRYYKIDPIHSSVMEFATMGAADHWYLFPTITVDKDENIAITYSRSSLTEYCGAYFTTRYANDPPGLSGSNVIKEGEGFYFKMFSGTRNRWGDYMGIYLDPVNETDIWMFTEYAAGNNQWGTWTGAVRMVPFSGFYTHTDKKELNFGHIEINFTSDTVSAIISNWGENDLIISSIPDSVGPFKLLTSLSYPITISTYDTIKIDMIFSPTIVGVYDETLPITSNDPGFTGISLKGRGYYILPSLVNTFYASTGSSNAGDMLTINEQTGAGTLLGPSLFDEVESIAINPKTFIMYGVNPGVNSSDLLRVNGPEGDAYKYKTLDAGNIGSIAFDSSGTMYAAKKTGEIYTVDISSGTTTFVCDAPIDLAEITFHPETNELWAAIQLFVGSSKDKIFKINLTNGDTDLVGKTGLNTPNYTIEFDGAGNLFGITGSSATVVHNFISINTETGEGTLVGSTGFKNITSLAHAKNEVVGVDQQHTAQLPNQFELKQNYPNPFNPSTQIEFALPNNSNVKLTIYNLLGEVVNILSNTQMTAGYHKIVWNGSSADGNKVSSGIYFYELKAQDNNGNDFKEMKKMILMK